MEVLRTAKQRYSIKTDTKRNSKEQQVLTRTTNIENDIENNSNNNSDTDNSANYEACDLLFPDDSDENESNI